MAVWERKSARHDDGAMVGVATIVQENPIGINAGRPAAFG
jgi:hypothetical protein